MRRTMLASIGGLFLAAILAVPAWAANSNPVPARPGSLNYLEGQASIGTQALSPDSVGSVVLQQGQSLTTTSGKAELLLTPGVFLRVGENSSVKMISPGLANTVVQVENGRAMVEVTDIRKENDIRVETGAASTQLLKKGLYDFDADQNQVRVFDGKAVVFDGDHKVDLGSHREVILSDKFKAKDFDTKNFEDNFYRWSSLRSGYLAEANLNTANAYVADNAGWYGTGWYWNPWFGAYTFVPADGIFYSPFGWGFYSPLVVYRAPFVYGGPFYHRFGPSYYYPYAPAHGFVSAPIFRGGVRGGFRR